MAVMERFADVHGSVGGDAVDFHGKNVDDR
jgi:hypothetical protein